MKGIDVSHHNGVIDWNKVKADPQGIEFVYVKATQGTDYSDPMLVKNVKGAIAAGLKWGVYHFATWNSHNIMADAKAEAAHYLAIVKSLGTPTMPLVLDAESDTKPPLSPEELLSFITIFMSEVTKLGYDIALYSFPSWINSYLPKNHGLGKYKFWEADYNGPLNPVNGFPTIWMRQFSSTGRVSGISTNVDMNQIL